MRKISAAVLVVLVVLLSCASLNLSPVKAATYTYTAQGPYWDDGTVANANVSMAWSYPNGTVYRGWLNATGGSPSSLVVGSSSSVEQVLWSEEGTENVRYMDLDPDETSLTFKILIPSAILTSNYYYVSVSDFAGVSNGWLESRRTVSGVSTACERRSLNFSGDISLLLAQWGTYSLAVITDQGTYLETFMAGDPDLPHSIILMAGMFSTSYTGKANVTAVRTNSSQIIVQQDFSDSAEETVIRIWHLDEYSVRSNRIPDYDSGSLGSGDIYLSWNSGRIGFNYFVDVEVTIDSVVHVWNFSLPASSSYDAGGLGEALSYFEGSSGISLTAAVAFLVCLIVAGICSYAEPMLGAALTLVCAGVEAYLGLYTFTGGQLGLGAFMIFLGYINESKKRDREFG